METRRADPSHTRCDDDNPNTLNASIPAPIRSLLPLFFFTCITPRTLSLLLESVENLRPGKRYYRVHDTARRTDSLPSRAQNNLFMIRVESNPGWGESRKLLHR